MKKNVLIVNYNTQKLTEACIKSVNKHTSGCTIYVFDNSDKEPFVNNFGNVTVLDNTKGQIIDFNEWLKRYPNSKISGEATKICGSAKHSYTIETCLKIISGGFVLLDSDVLVKKDFSSLYDKQSIYVGEVITQPHSTIKRVLPFICYINSKMCLEENLHYFDEKKMHGLAVTSMGNLFDTGAAFFLNSKKLPHREINCEDYVIHLKGGSWFNTQKEYQARVHKNIIKTNPDEWLEKYRSLWDENYEEPEQEEKIEKKEKPQTPITNKIKPTIPKYPQNKR